jgi:hypothetical protein
LRHYIWWLLLAPLLLVEVHALHTWLDFSDLLDSDRSRRVTATVVGYRDTARSYYVRYQFQVDGDQTNFSASDLIGRTDLWVSVTPEAYERAKQQSNQLDVLYLADKPWINQPLEVAGSPLMNLVGAWLIFLVIDLLWVVETVVIGRNFLRCQLAAERREQVQLRFWRTVAV